MQIECAAICEAENLRIDEGEAYIPTSFVVE